MKHAILPALLLLVVTGTVSAQTTRPTLPPDGEGALAAIEKSPRHGEWVEIRDGDEENDDESDAPIKAWVVYPERSDNAPVVIVIHEIYGLTDWVRGVADALAAEGFIAVAPDLLSGMGPDGGGTDSFEQGQVREAIRGLAPEKVEERLDEVAEWTVELPSSTDSVGVIGFCWGGSASFNYAADADDDDHLRAAVVYYGTAPTGDDALGEIDVPVLGLYGGDDNRVTSTVEATKQAMEKAGKPYETHIYEGAGHGFLRQQSGRDGANGKAAREAWQRTIAFFKQHLEGQPVGDDE